MRGNERVRLSVRSIALRHFAANLTLAWFDYSLLCGVQLAVLVAVSIRFAPVLGAGIADVSIYFELSVICLLYTALTAATATILPRKAEMPVLPIIESWRDGSSNMRRNLSAIVVGLCVGTLSAYASVMYEKGLIRLLHHPIGHHVVSVTYSPLAAVSTAIIEEILFRATIFPALVLCARGFWQSLYSSSGSTPTWVANVLQALIFGAAHVAAGIGILRGLAWYARVPLVSQTWGGLILGWIYWRYGLESATLCHATFDLFLLGIGGGIRLSLFS